MATKKFIPDNTGKTNKKQKQDQRVLDFTRYYTDINSPIYQNALQCGLKAGYSREYSENITSLSPKWFKELQGNIQDMRARLLAKSEKHFEDALSEPYTTEDKDRLKIKHDTAKHVSETIGKSAYSKRQELTDANGRRLFGSNADATASIPLADLFRVS